MPASPQPAELRHDTAVSAPLSKDSLLNQIYPPCHFHRHSILCLCFLAVLMQSLSTAIIDSPWLRISQSWTDLLCLLACFIVLSIWSKESTHTMRATLSVFFCLRLKRPWNSECAFSPLQTHNNGKLLVINPCIKSPLLIASICF